MALNEVGQEINILCGLSYLSARGHLAGLAEQDSHWSPMFPWCLHCCWRWICPGTLGRNRQALGDAACAHGKVSVDCLTLSVGSFWLPLCTDMNDLSRCKNQTPRFQAEMNLKSKQTQNLQGKFWIKFLLEAGPCPWKCFCALKARSLNISGVSSTGAIWMWVPAGLVIPTSPALEEEKAVVCLVLSLVSTRWLLCSHVLVHFAQTFHCSPLHWLSFDWDKRRTRSVRAMVGQGLISSLCCTYTKSIWTAGCHWSWKENLYDRLMLF